MKLAILKDTSESIEIKLDGAAATTEPDWTSHFYDEASGSQTLSSSNGVTTGATEVAVVAAPSGSDQRVVKEISVTNVDTADVIVSVLFVDGANKRLIAKNTVSPGGTYIFTDASDITGGASPVLTTKGDLYTYSTEDIRLAVGANDYSLTPDSGEATGLKWGPKRVLATTYVNVVSSTSKTIMATFSVPANSLSDNGSVSMIVPMVLFNNTGGDALTTLDAEFGSTNIGTISNLRFTSHATNRSPFAVHIFLQNAGATNSQLAMAYIVNGAQAGGTQIINVAAATFDRTSEVSSLPAWATAAEDTTSAVTLKVSITLPSSSASLYVSTAGPQIFGPVSVA